ncbi:hypothetical protein LUZ60_014896 [Juncus effusus]|nr:hypothetical protein LUZ60_014896 [Juncus effusus]
MTNKEHESSEPSKDHIQISITNSTPNSIPVSVTTLNSNPPSIELPNLGEKASENGSAVTPNFADNRVVTPIISIVISRPEEVKNNTDSAKNSCLSRNQSCQEICRVCQQPSEEVLVDLGCRCRGDLSKAHRTCIDIWFRTKGSNKCEICQQVAENIPVPEPAQQNTSYWVWRVDSSYRGGRDVHERRCLSPLWIAFAILIGGLLLDVLISISLGVSALPVNIIIGVLIVLGLGTAFRLGLECCHELGAQRTVHRVEMNISPAYPAAV